MRIPFVTGLLLLLVAGGSSAEQSDLDSFLRQMSHESAEQRREAARAIGDLGPKAVPALSALVRALDDADADVSVAAAYSIGDIGPHAKDAIPALIAALSDTREATWGSVPGGPATVEGAAWFALHEIGPEAAKPVTPFLRSKNHAHRELAVWGISAGGKNSEPFIPAIVDLLNDDEKSVRYAAIDALGELRTAPSDTVPALTAALTNEDIHLRIRSTVSLSKYGSAASKAVAALAEQLRHDNSTLRGFAAFSLGRIGPAAKESLPELRRLSGDTEPVFNNLVGEHGMAKDVRVWANEAIRRIATSKTRSAP